MNNKDREHIGYISSISQSIEEFKDRLFEYDEKIKIEYELFEDAAGRDNDVDKLYEKMMIEKYGHEWALFKSAKHESKNILEKARKQVYGDSYNYIFGNDN